MRASRFWPAVLALAAIVGPGAPAQAWPGPYVTVAADGSGDFSSIQAAVDAVPAGNASTFTIKIQPGVYHGQVIVPASKPYVVFRGQGPDPSAVVITDDRANGTLKPDGTPWGTSGSASVTIDGHDFSARNLTFENAFDEAAHPEITNRQAVAVLTRADRIVFDNVRFLGNQDTLYVNSPAADVPARVYLRKCYVEGDVDFVFGRATAVFDRCRVHSLDRGSATNNGYVTAASTSIANPYGFLFSESTFTGTAPAGTVHLGRPWHPSNDPNAIAQVLIRDSKLGAHIIGAAPWTDFGAFSWRDARYAEYANRGPGAVASVDRPQLDAAAAAVMTPEAYLAGADGWNPIR
ncbi:pectinesterase [Catellatospora sp. IY07-71]|uniref:pectinesterase family protein n=1 Tax=Catellatospora sp. IY07-71 TaxID=2728827 RepID=UPI001BB396BE|nr:pectinesterase family protein [Catellatospora sp. IY07-71]BCJ78124.1 pectinesterase [Catellatospora sp. IY07-71]